MANYYLIQSTMVGEKQAKAFSKMVDSINCMEQVHGQENVQKGYNPLSLCEN